MLVKPTIYDDVEVKEYGDYERLEVGGHKCHIVGAEEYTSELSGNTSLKITLDTTPDDKQPTFFKKQYDNNDSADKKWSNGAIKYVSLKQDENCVRMLKGFITAVENSNKGYTFDWNKDVNQLVGKFVAGNFGLEEYQDQEGEVRTMVKIRDVRSIDKLDSIKIPKVKLIDGTYIDYEEYQGKKVKNNSTSASQVFSEVQVEIKDEELPFDL